MFTLAILCNLQTLAHLIFTILQRKQWNNLQFSDNKNETQSKIYSQGHRVNQHWHYNPSSDVKLWVSNQQDECRRMAS